MILPWVRIQWISDFKGYGLFATRPIAKGTITFVQDGLDIVVTPENLQRADSRLTDYIEKYSYEDFLGNRIISWDLGKYMNHDDNANTLSTGYGFEVAVRDIEIGEEVTDDYRIFSTHHNTETWDEGPSNMDIKPWPQELLDGWNEKVRDALKLLRDAEQPLSHFVQDGILNEALGFVDDPTKYRCVSEAFPLRYKLQTGGIATASSE